MKSKIRFNSGMIEELQSLTAKHRRDRQLTRRNLTTRVPATPGPYSEFKSFLPARTRRQSDSTTDRPDENRRNFIPSPSGRHSRQISQNPRRESTDRHAAIDSRYGDSDDDVVSDLGVLSIQDRLARSPDQERGYADHRTKRPIAQQTARHSSERVMAPDDDQPRAARYVSPLTNTSRRPSTLDSDSRHDDARPDIYSRDSDRRQKSPTDSSRLPGRHAAFQRNPSSQEGAVSPDPPSRLERPLAANVAYQRIPADSAGDRRKEEATQSQNVDFFVPQEDVDLKVLATYLKEYVDPKASIERSRNSKVSIKCHSIRRRTNSSRDVRAILCTQSVP